MRALQPANATERVVARAWQEVLGIESIGMTDNFFDLGGHSVLLHMVRETLVRELRREVALVELFRYPTVRAFATHLDGAGRTAAVREVAARRDRLRDRRARRGAGVAR